MRPERLLIVDDEPANTRLLERLLRRFEFERIEPVNDSTKVIGAIQADPPDLVMLDLHMPAPDGFELLGEIGELSLPGPPLPVVMLTADIGAAIKHRALDCGAADFLTKPYDAVEVMLRVGNLLETRRLQGELIEHSQELERRVLDRTRDLDLAHQETLTKLARAAEFRDDHTGEHTRRVARTSVALARAIGLAEALIEILDRAAPLHDVGKIGIPDAVLLKPGKLTAEEFDTMKRHTELGAQILAGGASDVLRAAAEITLSHHERWDGSGYPAGLRGEQIPLFGRIVAIADVYDALTSSRPYKEAWSTERSVAEIVAQSGRHFDPRLVDAFAGLEWDSFSSPDRQR